MLCIDSRAGSVSLIELGAGVQSELSDRYLSSVYVQKEDCVYALPATGSKVLRFDVRSKTAKYAGDDLNGTSGRENGNMKWVGGSLAADGSICESPAVLECVTSASVCRLCGSMLVSVPSFYYTQ